MLFDSLHLLNPVFSSDISTIFVTSLPLLDNFMLFSNEFIHNLLLNNNNTFSSILTPNSYSTNYYNLSTNVANDLNTELPSFQKAPGVNYDAFDFLESEITRRQKKLPHMSRNQVFELMYGLGSDSMAHALSQYDNMLPTDYSNIYNHNGKNIDVSKLSPNEIMNLSCEVEDLEKLDCLDHIRSNYVLSIPTTKMYYPEPFIASASMIHNDLGFLHILQYQYWLWFFFVFLIVFFFITFICTVRWCNMRTQPRRETRGVSRSKCGDLITACVPVTWAMSIIVSESTDATDYYDGFGTSEVIVGVRAYQWGWEYYYPKNIDLNYNIKPSYSAFIGNSLKYTTSSEKTLNANDLWKFYQNKTDDAVITPAHLLVLPLDNTKMFNFLNFNNIGASTLQESNAFKKVRMFSKTFTTNLVHTPTIFTDKYVKLNSLYFNDNDYSNSFVYGLKRQHNLMSSTATTNTYSTFLDKNSMTKFLDYNLKTNSDLNSTNSFLSNVNVIQKETTNKSNISNLNVSQILNQNDLNTNNKTFTLLTLYPNLIKGINDDSDKTTFKYPLRKLFNDGINKSNLNNIDSIQSGNLFSNNTSVTNSYPSFTIFNQSLTSKVFSASSNNQGILPSDQSVRTYSKLTPNTTNYNLSNGLNTIDSNSNLINSNEASTTASDYFQLSKSNWADQSTLSKLSTNRIFFEAPYAPSISNNPHLKSLNYDDTNSYTYTTNYVNNKIIQDVHVNKGDSVNILKGRREGALKMLSTSYWQMFWANSNPNLRVQNALKSSQNNDLFYLPMFTGYYDYDFRNAQSIEMLEDLFWESSYSSYNHNDYLNIADNFNKTQVLSPMLQRRTSYYFNTNLNQDLKQNPITKSLLKDTSLTGGFYSSNIQFDDLISPANLMNTRDFSLFPLINSVNTIDESYSSYKNLNYLFNVNSSSLINANFNYSYPQSYLSVLNNFRADYEDFSWFVDLKSNTNSSESLDDSESTYSNPSRFSNSLVLRGTAKNSIVTYNALQKVFKARYEDGRSNIKINHFSDVRSNQPFLTDSRVSYERMLGKNKESFYNTTFYKNNLFPVLNDLSSYNSSLNFYFFDFPFLLSLKSDPSHFAWFDWFTKWAVYEVQPSSVSRYSTLGVPYSKKHFDFNVESGDEIQDSETYFTRIAKARKNYLPLWSYNPYLYTRSNVWLNNYKTNLLTLNNQSDISHLSLLLNEMNWYWSSLAFTKNTSEYFTPSISGNNIYAKSMWRPYQSIASYYYTTSLLADLLTKREFLYRQYLEVNNKLVNLPNILTANPNNPLLHELKSSFLLIDPITYNSEYSRDFYYNSLSFFKFLLFKNWISSINNGFESLPINTNLINDYLFFYFLNTNGNNKLGNNSNLYKDQYRPLKKGLTNMLRLHATGAVAMPIEIRLQVLASSRDVIHSWAIPSAGVKIDCVPGYTSHRIMIFFNSGIYWGQCMEICGRYHHWMPIIVYFMKRDLFFLWCTHFMSTTGINDMWDINDRQFTDYIRFASYDKNTWLTELSQNI